MIRRLGPRWITLHRAVYFIAVLAAIHFLLQTKNDVTQPLIMVGLLLWLFGYRLMQRRWRDVSLLQLAMLALVAGALTGPIETLWYHFHSGVPLDRIFFANFDFSYVIRPMWWVMAAGFAVVILAAVWRLLPQRTTSRRTVARPSSGATQAQSAS
jgi:sulfoxide reductase heme-binding subunit YedZ